MTTEGQAPLAPPARKRLFIRTWGCQMNVYDSARMADVLAPLGYAPAEAPEGADMVILNTCHIREKASEKLFSELGRLRELKKEKASSGEKLVLAVAGCVAQAEGAEITARAPWVDIVLGPQTYHKLPEMVARASRAAGAVIETDFPVEDKFDHLPEVAAPQGVTAFLTVQEGCDKFCSFCVVPYTRGAEYSRPAAAVLAEARRLVAAGAREIALLGQNVNAYHGEGPDGRAWGLGRLLREMADIPGLLRLRYTTSHPRDMDDDLIAAHAELPMLMPFLHLPVQSGSDRVLQAMNRGHGVAEFRRVVEKLRAARPDLALSSDFIVGHPGETAADFAATMALVREVEFPLAYSFKYSPRPGTPAAGAPHQVPEAEKDARLQALQALLREQQAGFNRSRVGMTMQVLISGPGRHPGQAAGRSPWLQPVHLPGDAAALLGREVPVTILAAHPNSLSGLLAASEGGHNAQPREEPAPA
ncbi:tRNA (N6-isopentenyl adenosine(37)-C2)-methylthiotransferase MiaB [Siccirubricoccus sp. KC 17139]|uniref:tRNA-2-methylthio-N(6)-dimethylallyladenosine synthase n=1 Tax=Siccirubricoccus soli TaxID=2899147 RepID=A0ABT1D1V1_9PROT|nr:tRNA (N6-isopentenyl adenosine(37)-C2)-methylthiotransferase MiaB [Siccirubricoccus soli]MCO6415896.1 tRNA (N6-isopentenyl adenosine(37)-C2)-methylthiotransferase MiaB [Siccirubricoccus soli]MCP2682028.1 tRNA (N6-isopentenyl adenosine(37)-C2)-methylthiotransferase MiaB [Siccirubricoccus soli]